jgi:AraC family transcriptional regulator
MFIEEHLEEYMELEDLAARAGFSPFHFHRVFSEVIGESPMAFIRRLRLERAVYRMKVSPDNVLQIGLEAGFQSAESFTRAFVRHFKIRPSEFRAMLAEFRRCLTELFGNFGDWQAEEYSDMQVSDESEITSFRLKSFAVRKVIFKRYLGGYSQLLAPEAKFEDLWSPLFDFADQHGLNYSKAELIGISHDDPYVCDKERVRFDACLPINGDVPVDDEIGVRELRSGMNSVREHFKGFEEIDNTFAIIGVEWIPAVNYMLDMRPPFEVYQCQEISNHLVRVSTESHVPLKTI